MTQSAAAKPAVAKPRMAWLDASRVFAAFLVVLVHSTTDLEGQPFSKVSPDQRFWPLMLRWFSEFSGTELFFVFSLFLLAFKLDRRPAKYGAIVSSQGERLLIPFAAWTIFYAFFRLLKAGTFGYAPAIWHEVSQWQNWVSYFVLGSAQYHLHFNPTLFAVILMYPLFEAAVRFPVAGFAIIPALFVLDAVQGYIWGHVGDPMMRDYLLRAVKVVTYGGYGMAAYSLFAVFKKGMPASDWRLVGRLAVAGMVLAMMTLLTYTYDTITTGQWGVRGQAANYGHFLMPLFVFAGFMTSQTWRWSRSFSTLAQYTYGVYLTHPIFIDVWDVGMKDFGLRMDLTTQVFAKWMFAAACALCLTFLLSRVKALAWLVGIGPTPFTKAFFRRSADKPGDSAAFA